MLRTFQEENFRDSLARWFAFRRLICMYHSFSLHIASSSLSQNVLLKFIFIVRNDTFKIFKQKIRAACLDCDFFCLVWVWGGFSRLVFLFWKMSFFKSYKVFLHFSVQVWFKLHQNWVHGISTCWFLIMFDNFVRALANPWLALLNGFVWQASEVPRHVST